jgi:N-acetyl-gamma-glutamyl-phosphate reductase
VGIRVAVAGGSGYAGGELLRLIASHPEFDLAVVTGHSSAGQTVGSLHPQLRTLADIRFAQTSSTVLAEADLAFLALPHGQSAVLAEQLPEQLPVVDLGADHRLTDPAAWERHYGVPHHAAWTYGLPELPGQRARIVGSRRVAVTGCYVAATALALAPLIHAGLASPEDVVVVAASGASGAGRTPAPHLLASQVIGDVAAYKVGRHQHTPEIKQATGAVSVSFTPVLVPMPRGILATVTARPARPVTAAAVRAALAAAYADARFVHLLDESTWPHTSATYGSNSCHLQATVDADSGRIVVVSALDNLGKGAAGQAVQCANLMLGVPETAGLSVDGVAP